MSQKNIKKCLDFARKMKHLLPEDFWTFGCSFYLDGTSFAHKKNPCDQAMCQKPMVWQKRCEGLSYNFTSKPGTGGAMAHFIVAIPHGKEVVLCKQYVERFTCTYFADAIWEHFHEAFVNSANPHGKLFQHDGDPRQNSMATKRALDDVSARSFSIPREAQISIISKTSLTWCNQNCTEKHLIKI